MTATKQIGESKRVPSALRNGVMILGLMMVSAYALADNVLQDVRYAAAPGGKVDITLQFANPVAEVQAFTTDSPPRIAIDLPNTTNGLTTRRLVIGSGATSAVSAAEAGGRTRVVVDLLRRAGYTTRSSGNLLVITVDAGAGPGVRTTAGTLAQIQDPVKRLPNTVSVSNIDFRRGDNGSGRVILRFSGAGAAPDMRSDDKQVVIDVSNVTLPENLRRRLDVTDFATPVVSVEPRVNAGGSRLVINTKGAFNSMAYQTGNEYVVEISPKRDAVVAGAPGRAAGAVGTGDGAQRYAGKPVTFNFQDVPVRTVLQLIAEESNLNIVVADTVGGSVTLRLINVPWDQALEILLRAKGLDQRRDGNVVWVAPQAELSAYELAQNNARIALENTGPLMTEFIQLNYASATELVAILGGGGAGGGAGGTGGGGQNGQRGFLSLRGTISADVRTNTLIIAETALRIREIKKLLLILDRAVDQVLIEARVVIADESFARNLGAQFGFENVNNPSPTSDRTTTTGFDIDLSTQGGGAFTLGILSPSSNLSLELTALEAEGRGEVVSNPRVITTNQREASITQGEEIGYTTPTTGTGGGQAIATPAFKDALLELKVTPTITSDGRVFMNLFVKKDDVKAFVNGVPSLIKRSVTTGVMVDSGDTVVVGGVYEFRNRKDVEKLPWVGDLPILGNLFKKTLRGNSKAELLIFVTPRVLKVAPR